MPLQPQAAATPRISRPRHREGSIPAISGWRDDQGSRVHPATLSRLGGRRAPAPENETRLGFLFCNSVIDLSALFARFVQPGFRLDKISFPLCPQLQLESLLVE